MRERESERVRELEKSASMGGGNSGKVGRRVEGWGKLRERAGGGKHDEGRTIESETVQV